MLHGVLLCFLSAVLASEGQDERLMRKQEEEALSVMFWNVENFFDYKDGGRGESDTEFSSFGSRRWTRRRFEAKCHAFAKAVLWIQDHYGNLPDIIGLAEVENKNVLFRILKDTALRKADYAFIHYDGRDRRGIDVAVLYSRSVMSPVSVTRKVPVLEDGDTLATRDILHVEMQLKHPPRGIGTIDFIVNHHPSKYGGEKESAHKRMVAMNTLKHLADSLHGIGPSRNMVIAMGDFNDTPDSEAFTIISNTLVNKASALFEKGYGTIRYEGRWDLIDMFLVSPQISQNTAMEIVEVPFLTVRDTKHPGVKPFRTYSGPKYIGGVSDHNPVILTLYLQNN